MYYTVCSQFNVKPLIAENKTNTVKIIIVGSGPEIYGLISNIDCPSDIAKNSP
jgi:hypothetical protein